MGNKAEQKDKFVIHNKAYLSLIDEKILSDFYQALVGPVAISLYLNLNNKVKDNQLSDEFYHEDLLKQLLIDIDSFNIAREKLEAVGLLKTFKKDNEYVYQLYKALDPYQFFNNQLLNQALYENLGDKNYQELKNKYQSINVDLKDYDEITKDFDQVFKVLPSNKIDNQDLVNYEIKKIVIRDKINFDTLISSIDSSLVKKDAFNESTKELINNLAFLYDIDTITMIDLVLASINHKGLIDSEILKEKCRNLYLFEKSSYPKLVYKKNKNSEKLLTKKDKLIKTFEVTSPYQYLKSKSNNSRLSKSEMKIIEYLLIDKKMEPEVINVLISYVLHVNNQKFTKNYVDTIASQWVRLGIKTAEEAMKISSEEYNKIKNKNKKKNNYNKSNKRKDLSEPEWFNKENDEELEESEELQDLLKDFD